MKTIIFIFISLSFLSFNSSARTLFDLDDYYRLSPKDQRRYLGNWMNFQAEFERAKIKYGYKKLKKKRRLFRYYNSYFMQFLQSVTEVAKANRAAKRILCHDNGVNYTFKPEDQEQQCGGSRFGTNMRQHLQALIGEHSKGGAGLKLNSKDPNCKPGVKNDAGVLFSPCGLVGLRKDLTLACSASRTAPDPNNASTPSCIGQGDVGAGQAVIKACEPLADGLPPKGVKEVTYGDATAKIACRPLVQHLREQMAFANASCVNQEAQSAMKIEMVSAVTGVCSKSFDRNTKLNNGVLKFEGPQTNSPLGAIHSLGGPEFGSAMPAYSACLAKKNHRKQGHLIVNKIPLVSEDGKEQDAVAKFEGTFSPGSDGKFQCMSTGSCKPFKPRTVEKKRISVVYNKEVDKYKTRFFMPGTRFTEKMVAARAKRDKAKKDIEELKKKLADAKEDKKAAIQKDIKLAETALKETEKEIPEADKEFAEKTARHIPVIRGDKVVKKDNDVESVIGKQSCYYATPVINSRDPALVSEVSAAIIKIVDKVNKAGNDKGHCNIIETNKRLKEKKFAYHMGPSSNPNEQDPNWNQVGEVLCEGVHAKAKSNVESAPAAPTQASPHVNAGQAADV